MQAGAWLELALEGHAKEAEAPLRSLRETLPADDIDTAEKLKPQLTRH